MISFILIDNFIVYNIEKPNLKKKKVFDHYLKLTILQICFYLTEVIFNFSSVIIFSTCNKTMSFIIYTARITFIIHNQSSLGMLVNLPTSICNL